MRRRHVKKIPLLLAPMRSLTWIQLCGMAVGVERLSSSSRTCDYCK
jgi:hypothetical protein